MSHYHNHWKNFVVLSLHVCVFVQYRPHLTARKVERTVTPAKVSGRQEVLLEYIA